MKTYYAIAMPLALIAALAGCSAHSEKPSSAAAPQTTVVHTAAVQQQMLSDKIELSAKVQADPSKVIRVFPPAGGRVVEVMIRPGDRVRSGQTLATLQSSDVASARSEYEKADIEAGRAVAALKRASLLYENQVLAEKDYLDVQAVARSTESELARAKERLTILGLPVEGRSDQLQVVAPRSGVVLDLGAAAGEFSKALDAPQPICTIADLGTVWIVGDLYEKDLSSVHPGAVVDVVVSAYPNQVLKGKVDAVSGAIDSATRTLKVRVVLSNSDMRLKPEMFATIQVVRTERPAIVVPKTAVLRDGENSSVFVQSAPGKFERRDVKLGSGNGGNVEIASGIRAGETIVTDGAELLREGSNNQ